LALEAAELRSALDLEAGRRAGAESSLVKIEFSETLQRIESLTLSALGASGLWFRAGGEESAAGAMVGAYMNNRAVTIYGGTSEIQRELIAKHLVGL
jgi:alkylation response protein AidB-like acyl-CoA dehydrogenase